MDITWYGHSCFRISERGKANIVTDPYSESIGYAPLNLKADIVTISHDVPGHAHIEAVRDWQLIIDRPGEYELGSVLVIGKAMVNKKADHPRYNVAYYMDYGAIHIAHLGDLDYVPSQSELDGFGDVHIALMPVGGGAALTASQAAEVVAMLDPGIVIPMHFQTGETRLDLNTADKFLTEMGVTNPEVIESLRISSSSLPEQTQVVLLERKE